MMAHFEDLFEMFEDVRQYQLRPKERLIPIMSVTGVTVGYSTADSDHPAIQWTINLRKAKAVAQARGTKESRRIRELFASHMGRKQLLDELRAGDLDYGYAAPPQEEPEPQEVQEPQPTQLKIPGL